MKKIIGFFKPFDFKQSFYVYENGNKIDVVEAAIEEIPEILFQLKEKYNINDIEFSGASFFTKKIVKEIKEKEFLKYNANMLNIQII